MPILNTRPSNQAKQLTQLLESFGETVCHLPVINIVPLSHPIAIHPKTNWLIFLSQNAVSHFFLQISAKDLSTLPLKGIIAIGPATKKALKKYLDQKIIMPTTFNSEGILNLPAFSNPCAFHISIVCGKNTKPLLPLTLKARTATVNLIPCYERKPIPYTQKMLRERLEAHDIDAIISTSYESLQALCHLFHTQSLTDQLVTKRLYVVTPKMAEYAEMVGFTDIVCASNATDEAIITAMGYNVGNLST